MKGLRARKVAALARTVLFRRVQTLLIRPHGVGLIGTTLNFDYEVRSAEEAFHDIPAMTIKGEMLDLAKHIISTKRGKSIRASSTTATRRLPAGSRPAPKSQGKPIERRKPPASTKVVDPTEEALRQSALA